MSKEVIEENWESIDKVVEKVKEMHDTDEAGFALGLFSLDGLRRCMIKCTYRKKKSNGEYTKKRYYTDIQANFCPFSGKPLYNEIEEEE